MKHILTTVFLLFVCFFTQAQNRVEMAFDLRSSGKIYVVVLVLLTIFIGVAIYLFTIDKKIRKLEDKYDKKDQ